MLIRFFKLKLNNPTPYTYPCPGRFQNTETYKKNKKKETLVRFFKVNSKKIPYLHPRAKPKKKIKQRNVSTFL